MYHDCAPASHTVELLQVTRTEAEAEMKAAVQQALEMARQRFEAEMNTVREEAAAAAELKFKNELRKARKQAQRDKIVTHKYC